MPLDEDLRGVLDSQLRNIVNVSPNQCCFVRGCNSIHPIRLLMERRREERRLHTRYSSNREGVWSSISRPYPVSSSVPWSSGSICWLDTISVLQSHKHGSMSSLGLGPFKITITVGVHQGSTLLQLLLFIRALIQLPHYQMLFYVDDVLLVCNSRRAFQHETQTWQHKFAENGMRQNI